MRHICKICESFRVKGALHITKLRYKDLVVEPAAAFNLEKAETHQLNTLTKGARARWESRVHCGVRHLICIRIKRVRPHAPLASLSYQGWQKRRASRCSRRRRGETLRFVSLQFRSLNCNFLPHLFDDALFHQSQKWKIKLLSSWESAHSSCAAAASSSSSSLS